jgi:hypothetical protein
VSSVITATLTTPSLDRTSRQVQYLSRWLQPSSRNESFIDKAENLLTL